MEWLLVINGLNQCDCLQKAFHSLGLSFFGFFASTNLRHCRNGRDTIQHGNSMQLIHSCHTARKKAFNKKKCNLEQGQKHGLFKLLKATSEAPDSGIQTSL
jgi:hypothetical protein